MMHLRRQYTHCLSVGRDASCSVQAARIMTAGARQPEEESDMGVLSPESSGVRKTQASDHAIQILPIIDLPDFVYCTVGLPKGGALPWRADVHKTNRSSL